LLGAACTADGNPNPPPSVTVDAPYNGKPNKEQCEKDPRNFRNYGECIANWDNPYCAVKVEKIENRTITFYLDVKNGSKEGVYDVGKAQYIYGDGTREDNGNRDWQPHTFAQAGSYAVNGSIVMDVAPNVEAPFRGGHTIPCIPTTVTVG
jgi:hypothetical protein